MAVPFLLGAGAIGAGLLGAAGMMSAKEKFEKANDIAKSAERDHQRAVNSFEKLEIQTKNEMVELGKFKLEILGGPIKKFVELYKKISNVKFKQKEIENCDFLKNLTPEEINKLELTSINAAEIVSGGLGALSTGALAGVGAYGLVGTLATASTGTAISTLSGVAASNATWAWLGGGSIAAGGWGVAGGMAVMGAAVLGPALLISAFVVDNNADKALTEAKEYSAKIDVAIEKIEFTKELIRKIQNRISEVKDVINHLNIRFCGYLSELSYLVESNIKNDNVDFNKLSTEEQSIIFNSANFVSALKTIIEVKIVKENFEINENSTSELSKTRKIL